MPEPRCSVILTSYNRPALLELAIKSVLAQAEPNWELIIADDNSGPAVDRIIEKYSSDPRISWFKSDVTESDRPKRARQSVQINRAFLATGSPLIFYLTDDNEYAPECVRRVCDYFDANPGVMAVYVPQETCLVDWKTGRVTSQGGLRPADEVKAKGVMGVLDHTQVMHRREVFGNGWREEPEYWGVADGVFFESIIARGCPLFPVIGSPLVLYKISPETSMCRQVDREAALRKLREEGDRL